MDASAFWILLALGLIGTVLLALTKRGQAVKEAENEALRVEAEQWFHSAIEKGSVPRPELGSIIVPAGESPLLSEPSRLFELRGSRASTHVGTRVNVGGMPIYLGRSVADSGQSMQPVADGRVALTTKTLLFVGDARTITVPAREIVEVQVAARDALQISTRKRKTPFVIRVRNPILWAVAVQHASAGSISPS